MGAWAIDAFGNDDACDWACELEETDDLSFIDHTLSKALAIDTDYLEAPDASEGIAAAEVVARLQGNFGERNSFTEAVDSWVSESNLKPTSNLNKKAHAVLDRVLSEPSELLELWQESDEFNSWKASVLDIKSRIAIVLIS